MSTPTSPPRSRSSTSFSTAPGARSKADEGIRLCRGPLLSRAQYLVDVERWNYVDAREVPLGTMTPEEIAIWTKAIETKK